MVLLSVVGMDGGGLGYGGMSRVGGKVFVCFCTLAFSAYSAKKGLSHVTPPN